MADATILVADDDRAVRTVVSQALGRAGYDVRTTSNAATLWTWVSEGEGDLVITDVVMPDGDGLELLPRIKKTRPDLPVVVMSARNTIATAVKATQNGAYDYLPKPFDINELKAIVDMALSSPRRARAASPAPAGEDDALPIIGRSPAMQEIYRLVARLTDTDLTVLISGESGTGKELAARALHDYGQRKAGPFVAINMAAVPRDLIEAELFGHEKGAFTGAVQREIGRFAQAKGGTLFLDEIGDLKSDLQAKLLRAIQEGEVERVGGTRPVRTAFRLIAATHVDLERAVKDGTFREDLFYRINVIPVRLPPLRERIDDLPVLVDFFIRRYSTRFHKPVRGIAESTLRMLSHYWWPGNIRELENLVERLVAVSDAEWITDEDLPVEFHVVELDRTKSDTSLLDRALGTFERNFLVRALERNAWNVTQTSRYLGVPLSTLKFKMERLEVRELARKLKK